MSEEMFIKTPLLESPFLSSCVNPLKVFLKLENCQPCNSFKIRGISHLCQKLVADGYKEFVTFSGGNAGIALAYVASRLKLPCHVVVPAFVSTRVSERIKFFGGQIHVAKTARAALDLAINMGKENLGMAFVHPYDDPILWEAYANIVTETKEQLNGQKPSCFVLSVGGGGLLMGILTGLEAVGWSDVPVVTMETEGAACFNKTLRAGEIVENVFTSIAKTLGAPSVTPALLDVLPKFKIISAVLPDAEAVTACLKFADHHAFLVEPACGVSLAVVYEQLLPDILQSNGVQVDESAGPVVMIVCGGSDTNVDILRDYALQVGVSVEV